MKKDQKPSESVVQSTLSELSGKQSNGPEQRKDRRHKKPMISWQDEAVLGLLQRAKDDAAGVDCRGSQLRAREVQEANDCKGEVSYGARSS